MLPTGAGKTICFAISALITGGVTIVVCPLLSLMLDQVNRLRAKGLNSLSSGVPEMGASGTMT